MMKAYTFNSYSKTVDVLGLTEVPKPENHDDTLLVKVRAVSVNAADWRTLQARPFLVRLNRGLFAPRKPFLGQDFAGVVEAQGTKVHGFPPGTVVMGMADECAFAEYVRIRPDQVCPIPPDMSFEDGAVLPLAGSTALMALINKGGLQPNMRVLINGGGGGVGSFSVQIAKAMGAHVTAVCSTNKQPILRSLGGLSSLIIALAVFSQLLAMLFIGGNLISIGARSAGAKQG